MTVTRFVEVYVLEELFMMVEGPQHVFKTPQINNSWNRLCCLDELCVCDEHRANYRLARLTSFDEEI